MSLREIARADIPSQVPTLLTGRHVVILTPSSEPNESITAAAWEFARAAASGGRKVALIDLSLEQPVLRQHATNVRDDGIVDAFLYGASLEHVSTQQDVPGLHFIGVGTPPPDPEAVWTSSRWSRLVRGFASQDAVLLLFTPRGAVTRLAATPDLVATLCGPDDVEPGEEPGSDQDPSGGVFTGVPTVRIACEPVEIRPSLYRTGPAVLTDPSQPITGERRRRLAIGAAVSIVGLVAAGVAAAAMLWPTSGDGSREEEAGPLASAPSVEESPAGRTFAADSLQQPIARTDGSEDDSLFYSVQVVSMANLGDAVGQANSFHSRGYPTTVTAARLEPDRIWYRVLVGVHATATAAAATRQALRARGLLGSGSGVLLRTPYALLIDTAPQGESAAERERGLRESGIPAYIVPKPDGTFSLLVGACETPDQARLTDSILSSTDESLSFALVSRTGTVR